MGFYGHALHAAFGQPEAAHIGSLLLTLLRDMKCMLATVFFAVFGAVIALMKDVPDIKGDRLNDIKSFSVRAGAGRIFRCVWCGVLVCLCVQPTTHPSTHTTNTGWASA